MKTNLSKSDVLAQATSKLGKEGFSIRSNSETSMVFEGGKDLNWLLIVVLFIFTALIGVFIYWILARRKQIIMTFMPVERNLDVLAAGNTRKSNSIGIRFVNSLPKA